MQDTQRTIDAVWRIEAAKLIGALARVTGDVGLAEDLAQDALVAALEQWPADGIPQNPGAWLMATAKHKAIDRIRRDQTATRKVAELGRELEQPGETGGGSALQGASDLSCRKPPFPRSSGGGRRRERSLRGRLVSRRMSGSGRCCWRRRTRAKIPNRHRGDNHAHFCPERRPVAAFDWRSPCGDPGV